MNFLRPNDNTLTNTWSLTIVPRTNTNKPSEVHNSITCENIDCRFRLQKSKFCAMKSVLGRPDRTDSFTSSETIKQKWNNGLLNFIHWTEVSGWIKGRFCGPRAANNAFRFTRRKFHVRFWSKGQFYFWDSVRRCRFISGRRGLFSLPEGGFFSLEFSTSLNSSYIIVSLNAFKSYSQKFFCRRRVAEKGLIMVKSVGEGFFIQFSSFNQN